MKMDFVGIIILIVVLISALLGVLWLLWVRWRDFSKSYNQAPLQICTFEGSQSPYHPSALFFPEGWSGHRYYLIETPFCSALPLRGKNYRDRYECPSFHVSEDGLHWSEPSRNPIADLSADQVHARDYYSDPHLVYRDGRIECWYRLTERHGNYDLHTDVSILRKYTTDGVLWTREEQLAHLSATHPLGAMVISPAVMYRGGKYHIWYVAGIDGQRDVAYATSENATDWTPAKHCRLRGYTINPWHIDVAHIDGVFWLIVFDRIDLSLWRSEDGETFDYVKSLLLPSHVIGSFYYKDFYRACLIKADGLYRLYFSADDSLKTSIGVMEGTSPDDMRLISVDGRPYRTYPQFVRQYIRTKYNYYVGRVKRLVYLYVKRPMVRLMRR